MQGHDTLFSHLKDDWQTPRSIFDPLQAEFKFTIDAAANEENSLCEAWWGPGSVIGEDALMASWQHERCWLNPPYSLVKQFVEKASQERYNNALTVLLLPSRTDTRWFHDYLWDRINHTWRKGIEGRFLKGRIKFEGPDGSPSNSASFPSMIVVMRPSLTCQLRLSSPSTCGPVQNEPV